MNYMLLCSGCPLPLPVPFPSERDRSDWATSHTAETGHDGYQIWEEPVDVL